MTLHRRSLLALLPAPFIASCASTRDLAADMQRGGYVIYLRHAQSDGKPEPALGDIKDCLWQSNLTPAGKTQATTIGQILKGLGVRYGQIGSSPFCRCRDTAQLVTGRPAQIMPELQYHTSQSPNAQAAAVERLRVLVSNREPGGRCTLLVGHAPPFKVLAGMELAEAQAAIIRPRQTKEFDVVGLLDPSGVQSREDA
ncbi:histidine phosphatase family protein [Vineibacter terrae]|uniref:histidine phosphatase family protein n=1 Tax=Vineibacter terrae TaxID=2586908 RepID=UPI002E31AB71|nr:histidine phosphatase family protein [Vineibacter terrae]HEX2885498.1 histidine phosphatase family protein [Vineibacter terrae]